MTDGAHGAPEHSKPGGGHVVQSTATRYNVTRPGMIFIRHAKDAMLRYAYAKVSKEAYHMANETYCNAQKRPTDVLAYLSIIIDR